MKPDHKKRRSKKRKKGYCKAHEKKRRNGGKALKSRFKAMLKAAEEFLKGHPETRSVIRNHAVPARGRPAAAPLRGSRLSSSGWSG